MKELQLSNGKIALVDDEDYDRLVVFKWHTRKAGKTTYAYRTASRAEIRELNYPISIHLHREILNVNVGNKQVIDHNDGNGLNCQKSNLKPTTHQNNIRKGVWKPRKTATSKYRCVTKYKNTSKFVAYITIDGYKKHLGIFDTENEAALAYNEAANKYFGEFANLNKIKEDEEEKTN